MPREPGNSIDLAGCLAAARVGQAPPIAARAQQEARSRDMARIPFLRPNLVTLGSFERDLRSLEQTRLYSNFGPLNTRFEERIRAEYFGGAGALTTVNNATTGLMLAIALARRPGARYAVMPSFTFAATPLAAMWAGLTPYFVDVRLDDFCIDPDELARVLADLGGEAAVVVPYAAFGCPMDLSGYAALVRDGLPVVVDAAASFGASRDGIGFGTGFPGIVVYSFHATKAFGIGEGGLVYSADAAAIGRLRAAANFGFGPDKVSHGLGLNAKLPEIAAAVGLATLDAFPAKKRRRMEIYGWYRAELERRGMPQQGWALQRQGGEIAHQFFPLLCPPGTDNGRVIAALASRDVEARAYFAPPCHRQPAFARCPGAALANTEQLAARALSLPLWEEMSRDDVESVIRGIIG